MGDLPMIYDDKSGVYTVTTDRLLEAGHYVIEIDRDHGTATIRKVDDEQ